MSVESLLYSKGRTPEDGCPYKDALYEQLYKLKFEEGIENEFGEVYKINRQKSFAILYTDNEKSDREIKGTISFIISSKRIKFIVINLPKEPKTCTRKTVRQ